MFVKICGITHPDDARIAASAGADAIGLNFVSTSRRYVDTERAKLILATIPSHVMTVGVFQDQTTSEILATTRSLALDAVQVHGDTSTDYTAALVEEVATVIRVITVDGLAVPSVADSELADIVMLDAAVSGSGIAFDWNLVGDLTTHHKVVLAGGLRPDNVSEAVATVQPWGVDVATGVEKPNGRKDPRAITRFVAAARSSHAFG